MVLRILSGAAGGTGRGLARLITEALVAVLEEHCQAVIIVELVRVGAVSYLSLIHI